MCIYGNIIKEEIKREKKQNPKNFIEISEALNSEEKDQSLFALGLLANTLQQIGMEVAIEKGQNEIEKELDEGTTCLQFITNGMISKKKYELHFDFGKKKNEEYLKDDNKFEELKDKLKEKIAKDYNISKDKIIVAYRQRGCVAVQIIFQSDEFNNLNIDEFKSKFKNEKNFPELQNLKEIHEDVIVGGCKLSRETQLDPAGNRISGWGVGEKRGRRDYNPPLGWIGIGLKVKGKFENDDWIGMNNSDGEWCVAYHGVGRSEQNPERVKQITGLIYKTSFKVSDINLHGSCDDKFHSGNKVGKGVYCATHIETAQKFAGISEINGKKYKTVLMVRVKPDATRGCNCQTAQDYYVVNGTIDEIRPYRILYKSE